MLNHWKNLLLATTVSCLCGTSALAQGEQQIFQDDRQLVKDQNQQINQEQNQEQMYAQQVQQHDSAEEPFRQYAQKRIVALSKMRMAHGSPALSAANEKQLYALQQWLEKDSETRIQEQAHIKALDQAIANLSEQRNGQSQNLGADVNAMREDQEQLAEDDRFNKMMKINQFNELQSEMGAATWGRPPTDGTFNSVGGYGMGGGYGYSFGGGRRW